ncbi:hypothetical protein [Leifsonia sp. Leaf264]|uniref:hypothetical protein n=1 Tax=Leifsonia sp. Leaf264 TaxID=1736314 RepID=UPI0006FFBB83|nr:hypothetical protein [Leifsonia sp. Leaf264]KQO98190.1 hypothetical protein ASF30_09015 [Leifsonia sp. Leaf264]
MTDIEAGVGPAIALADAIGRDDLDAAVASISEVFSANELVASCWLLSINIAIHANTHLPAGKDGQTPAVKVALEALRSITRTQLWQAREFGYIGKGFTSVGTAVVEAMTAAGRSGVDHLHFHIELPDTADAQTDTVRGAAMFAFAMIVTEATVHRTHPLQVIDSYRDGLATAIGGAA